jgi:hypothetical protein
MSKLHQRRLPFRVPLAVTPLMTTPLPTRVAAGARLIAIVLAIPLNTFLLLDFTGTVLSAFAFHPQCSFPQESMTPCGGVYFLRSALSWII